MVMSNVSFLSSEYAKDDGATENKEHNDSRTFLRVACTLLLRVGFLFVQMGVVPVENVYVIVLQNFLDASVTILAFALVGYQFAYGPSLKGIMGFGFGLDLTANMDDMVTGFSVCLASSAIILTCLIGRVKLITNLLVSFFHTCITSILMHCIWNKEVGIFHYNFVFGENFILEDYGGTYIMHISSAAGGLIALIILGERIMKLSELDKHSITKQSIGTVALGYVFITLGLMSIMLPNTHENNFITKTLLGLASGCLTIILILSIKFRSQIFTYWNCISCLQASLAAQVTITAGLDVFHPVFVGVLSTLSTFIFYFAAKFCKKLKIEDNCNIVAIHLICASFGAILANYESLNFMTIRFTHTIYQLLIVLIVGGISAIFYFILFFALKTLNLLRNRFEEQNRLRMKCLKMNMTKNEQKQYGLFQDDKKHLYLEPELELQEGTSNNIDLETNG